MRNYTIQEEIAAWTRHVNEVSGPILDSVVRCLTSVKTEYVKIDSQPNEGPSMNIRFKIVPWDGEEHGERGCD